ncbi:hypothetical protein MF672_038565 [Actinomadura sp. ATCC 31491]|uniref:FXSXX-COOH protein n=1 Tax=Actinomadura luzonensis TaxID=2805427 RepID=A0ABT0G4X9_9ACTN|nr:hypothetical protein [Actinomadura luzonensis]MCK2219657.1 hypothetical protein [Actinomadura luzonensis]
MRDGSSLIDVNDISLWDLAKLESAALKAAVTSHLAADEESTAAFSNSI